MSKDIRTGIQRISDERTRQIAKEGWTSEHDDQHEHNELAWAAATGSRAAHEHPEQVEEIRTEMERLYLKICRLGSRLRDLKDARVASQRLGEIGVDPSRLVSGEVLEAELDDLLS